MGSVRKTKALETILEIFKNEAQAISVMRLVERLQSQMNKTTVYRVLQRLEDDGVIHSFLGKDGFKWYAKCNGCSESGHMDVHPHFQCQDCGKVDCLNIEVQIPNIPQRKIASAQLLLLGTCDLCAES